MTRGGKRSTSWTPGWRHGKTQTIRVPVALAPALMAIARGLDEGLSFQQIDRLTNQQFMAHIEKDEFGCFWAISEGKIKTELFLRSEDETPEDMEGKGYSLFASSPEELWIATPWR